MTELGKQWARDYFNKYHNKPEYHIGIWGKIKDLAPDFGKLISNANVHTMPQLESYLKPEVEVDFENLPVLTSKAKPY